MNNSGSMLRDKRLEKGMSLRYLAQLSDVSHTEISKIEKGERENPNRNVLIKLANALDIDTNKFLSAFGYISDELIDMPTVNKYSHAIEFDPIFPNAKFNIIQANKFIINNIKKEIKYSIGSSVEFDEQYKINNKIVFDFVGFDNNHSVYGCEIKHLTEMLPTSINSIKLSFMDFYFHFKHSFKDDAIKFYGVFIIKDENTYTKLESMLKDYFSHLQPIFNYIIYVEKDLYK